jgi:HEAT repeat protein
MRRVGSIRSARLGIAVWVAVLTLGTPARSPGQTVVPLRHAWEVRPDLGNIWETNSAPRAPEFDVEQLDSPEAELRVRTAQRICLHHDRDGLNDKPRAVELILKRLAMDNESLLIRRSMIAAAALIDDGSHAGELLAAAKNDSIMLESLDRALIRWKSPAATSRWRSLIASHHEHPTGLKQALEGIRWVGESQDIPSLIAVLRSNDATDSERWLASLAIGELDRSEGLPLALEILDSDIPNRFSLATNVLQYHTSNEAYMLLSTQVISKTRGEALRHAAIAIARQFPDRAVEDASTWVSQPEPTLRRLAAEALRKTPSRDAALRIASLMDDDDQGVRLAARQTFVHYSSAGLRAECDASIKQLMDSDEHARAKEQAALWMVEVRSTDYFEQLIRCLDHSVPEVHMLAAWALMELVEDPKWVEEVAKRCQSMTMELATDPKPATKSEIIRGSFLLEVLGKNRHRPSLDMLRQYIPKNDFKMGNLTRASAIWSLGQIQRDEDDPELRAQLMARMKDTPPMNPENYLVRFACILALGEFGYRDALPTLNSHGGDPPSPHGYATIWARSQIEMKSK